MALTDDNMVFPVAPMGNTNNGFGDMGGWWILFLIAMMWGGFGNGFGGFGGFGGGLGYDFPWLLNGQNGINANTNAGFQNAALTSQIGDLGTQINAGFSGLNAQLSNNQVADLERSFAAQTAQMQGMNAIQSQIANCCCESRLQTANLGSDIAREACATRTSDTQNTQAILNSMNAGFQSIKDQLYSDKMDSKNDEIAQLRQEVLFARGQSSQIGQNETIINGVYNRLNECPVGTVPVYGRQPIFNCNNGYGCGCGA